MLGVDADLAGDGGGHRRVVTGQQDGRQAQGAQPGDRLGAGLLHRVGDLQDRAGLAVPGDGDRGAAGRLSPGLGAGQVHGQFHGPLGEQLLAADQDRVALDHALDAEPRHVGEVLGGGQRTDPFDGSRGHRTGDRVLRGVLQRPGQAQHVGLLGALRGVHGEQRHAAGGDGAGLVEDDGVDLAGGLQDLRALDEDAELRAPPGADHERGRSGQAQGAGAVSYTHL